MLIVDIDFERKGSPLRVRARELKQNFHSGFASEVKSAALGSSRRSGCIGSIRVNIEITL